MTPAAIFWHQRHFVALLAAIVGAGLVCRVAILAGYLETPLAFEPIIDARTYWDWAGRIAQGQWLPDEPFFSAPLYPYLLGLLRWLGAGPPAVYVFQMLGDLAVAALLGLVCRRRFGEGAGLLAPAIYLLLQDPASSMLRVLACTLHVLLVVAFWAALVRWQEESNAAWAVGAGILLGLLCLAYAPALLLFLLLPLWLFAQNRRRLADLARPAALLGVAAAVISPAVWHNWRTGGGFLAVQAGSGITLLQGNHPDSKGVYTAIPGIDPRREFMHLDTARMYQQATGKAPKWADVDRYFRNQAVSFWRENPGRLFELLLRKLHLFFLGRHYADIYQPTAEMELGVNRLLMLAPVQVPWISGAAVVGFALLLRNRRRCGAEIVLTLVPLITVLAFFYSPRYRMPAVPMLVVAAALALVQAFGRGRRRLRVAVLSGIVAGILAEPIHKRLNVDRPSLQSAGIALAYAAHRQGNLPAAISYLRQALAIQEDVEMRVKLGELLAESGDLEQAEREFGRALSTSPDDPGVLMKLARVQSQLGRLDQARTLLQRAAQLEPRQIGVRLELAVLLRDAGILEEARKVFEQTVALAPYDVEALTGYGALLVQLGRWSEAEGYLARALACRPDDPVANRFMGVVAGQLGRHQEAQQRLEAAWRAKPKDASILHDLGVLKLIQGDRDAARQYFQQALEINPDFGPARSALERLK